MSVAVQSQVSPRSVPGQYQVSLRCIFNEGLPKGQVIMTGAGEIRQRR